MSFNSAKNINTVFFQINALGVYKIFTILGGGVYWRGALIREGRLFKRNRILTIGSFLFSMFLNYNSISMRSSSEWLGSMRLLLVFASSVSLSVISKGLLLRYFVFDSRYNAFTRNKKIAIVSDEELAKRKKL